MASELIYTLATLLVDEQPDLNPSTDDWASLNQLAWREGVAPLLGYQVQRKAFTRISEQVAQLLSVASLQVAQRHFKMRETLYKIQQRFEQDDIPLIWLKGMALSYIAYPQPKLRPMGDHDIWVQRKDFPRALAALAQLGFLPYEEDGGSLFLDPLDDVALDWSHHHVLVSAEGMIIELHHHVLLEWQTFLGEHEHWFWQQQKIVMVQEQAIRAFDSTTMLLYLCAHVVIHHYNKERLINYLDLHFMIENADIDWQRLLADCERLQWNWALLKALAATQSYFGTEIPTDVITALEAQYTPPEHLKKVEAMHVPRSMFLQFIADFRKTKPQHRLYLLRHIFFPTLIFLRKRYNRPDGGRVFMYIHHWAQSITFVLRMMRTPSVQRDT